VGGCVVSVRGRVAKIGLLWSSRRFMIAVFDERATLGDLLQNGLHYEE
jgi:hypothetical protein